MHLVPDDRFYYIVWVKRQLAMEESHQVENLPVRSVFIVGSGWVGRQIAAKLVISGLNVGLLDRDAATLGQAKSWIEEALAPENASVAQPTMQPDKWGKASYFEDWSNVDADCYDLALECVSEQLSIKKRVLRAMSTHLAPSTILASNSSYFIPSQLEQYVESPNRFAHLHFHVPVLRDSVVDIVAGSQTYESILTRLENLVVSIGAKPLRLRNEHPGYIFNWMLQSVLRSAMELVARDVVDPEDVDASWKSVTGMPLGPFGMMDQIGLDVIEQVLANSRWMDWEEVPTEKLLEMIRVKTKDGKLGRKTCHGFYRYPNDQQLH